MCKSILSIVGAFIIAVTASGCFGYISYLPAECKNETPTTKARDDEMTPPSSVPTKADFLKAWGMPDMINATSENAETWIYKRNLWCGLVPAFFIPVPLLLPVCDGFERIEFHGDNAKSLHIRRIVGSGFIIMYAKPNFLKASAPDCRYPLHSNFDSDIYKAKPDEYVKP